MNNIQNYNPNVSPAPQYIPYPPPVDLRFMTEQIEAWAYEAGKTQATLKFRENQLEAVSGLVKQYGASYIISSRGTPIQVFADQLSTQDNARVTTLLSPFVRSEEHTSELQSLV